MRLAIVSANLGSFDREVEWVAQSAPGYDVTVHRFTDANFPPRAKSMTSRLQSRIPKMFAWQMVPGADVYMWVDASFALLDSRAAQWGLEQLGDKDMAVFRHPERKTICEEYEFLKAKMAEGNEYLLSRYEGELLDEQMEAIAADPSYVDDRLFSAGIFLYRSTYWVNIAMMTWWHHTTRYHSIDQLAFPYVLGKEGYHVIEENIYRTPYITHIRNRQWLREHR